MKKRTLCVLLVSVFLMLVGIACFLFPVFTQKNSTSPIVYEVNTKFQQIEIDLEETNLIICSGKKTHLEINGYHESEYYISEENGKLLLTDRTEKTPFWFRLSGIGKYFKEIRHESNTPSIVLYLSPEHSHTPVNLILKNSTLNLSTTLDYLTLNAENSSVLADNMTFERFNGKLINCDASFSIPYAADDFSRNIETHNTKLSLNGDERANTELFTADFPKPALIIEAFDGICRLEYPQTTP